VFDAPVGAERAEFSSRETLCSIGGNSLWDPKTSEKFCIFEMTTVAVPAPTSNTSSHFEVASTTTKKSLFL